MQVDAPSVEFLYGLRSSGRVASIASWKSRVTASRQPDASRRIASTVATSVSNFDGTKMWISTILARHAGARAGHCALPRRVAGNAMRCRRESAATSGITTIFGYRGPLGKQRLRCAGSAARDLSSLSGGQPLSFASNCCAWARVAASTPAPVSCRRIVMACSSCFACASA
jgi:hypothetical protein